MKKVANRLGCSDSGCSIEVGFWGREPKPTSMCLYIFHLYHSLDTLKRHEILTYKAALTMLKYDISLI